MAVVWEQSIDVQTNPFDGTTETVINVYNVVVNGALIPKESYVFEDVTTDAQIRAKVEADLQAKGYVIA